MPRLPTSLLRIARAQDPLLIPLLRTCRDLSSARNELRWLTEHVEGDAIRKGGHWRAPTTRNELRKLCQERGRGKPLQYILGTEHFGELELKCKPGVLIPRPETADSLLYLISRLRFRTGARAPSWKFRILDLCTGSGCMSLLLHHALHNNFRNLTSSILGIDLSTKALKLANENLEKVGLVRQDSPVMFARANVFAQEGETGGRVPGVKEVVQDLAPGEEWEIVVANPPYISKQGLYKETARSVRNYEPRMALVPPPDALPEALKSETIGGNEEESVLDDADAFYPAIADAAEAAGARLLLVEVGDGAQARRVANMLASRSYMLEGQREPVWHAMEIWCDGIMASGVFTRRMLKCGSFHVPVLGPKERTHARTVVCWRGESLAWLQTDSYVDDRMVVVTEPR